MKELGNAIFLWIAALLLLIVLLPTVLLTCCIRFLAECVVCTIDCFEEEVCVPVIDFMQAKADAARKETKE